jgi:alpha-galactosidase
MNKLNKDKIKLAGNLEPFSIKIDLETLMPGLELIHIKLNSSRKFQVPTFKISWTLSSRGIYASLSPLTHDSCASAPPLNKEYRGKSNFGAPVTCLYGNDDINRLTYSFSDPLNPVRCRHRFIPETGEIECSIALFAEKSSQIDQYAATIRVDTRELPYYQTLDDVAKWWDEIYDIDPDIPAAALNPVYSTWYSFLQNVDADSILKQCKLAKEIGCDTVIIDDGWQTDIHDRSYKYCGDWQVCESKFPDMRELVSSVKDIGMKCMLWYAVPFIGHGSKLWSDLKEYALPISGKEWSVLDPRRKIVRTHLVKTLNDAVVNYGLDGLKLDFIDNFDLPGMDEELEAGDIESMPEATLELMDEAIRKFKEHSPEILTEFRQNYLGPLMKKYGNMFRAADCPFDPLMNRIRILDLRLMSGNVPVHSDMIAWGKEENVEEAALQLINVLFGVPQISLLIDELPSEHLKMLKFWLDFWRENVDVLMGGQLIPRQPHALYSSVTALAGERRIDVMHSVNMIVVNENLQKDFFIVNGSSFNEIIFNVKKKCGAYSFKIYDCAGNIQQTSVIDIEEGLTSIPLAPAGLAVLKKQDNK